MGLDFHGSCWFSIKKPTKKGYFKEMTHPDHNFAAPTERDREGVPTRARDCESGGNFGCSWRWRHFKNGYPECTWHQGPKTCGPLEAEHFDPYPLKGPVAKRGNPRTLWPRTTSFTCWPPSWRTFGAQKETIGRDEGFLHLLEAVSFPWLESESIVARLFFARDKQMDILLACRELERETNRMKLGCPFEWRANMRKKSGPVIWPPDRRVWPI